MSATGANPAPAPSAAGEPTVSAAGQRSPGTPRVHAAITEAPLSVDAVVRRVSDHRVGGIGVFIGVIRDRDEGFDVSSLDYTRHPSAEDVLRRCAERAAAAHDVLSVAVEHRVGHLELGDLAVVVGVGAVHREPALEACRQLIDELKAEVPIWKEQHFADGTTSWVGLG